MELCEPNSGRDGGSPASGARGQGLLQITALPHPSGTVVLHVVGEVDAVTAPLLTTTQIDSWIGTASGVVLDLAGVNFLASAGLPVLLVGRERARQAGCPLQLVCGDSHPVRRLLGAAGLVTMFDLVDP